jgi:hypothetical protein
MIGLQLLNLWLLKVMLRCVNDGVTTIKPGHQTTGNTRDMIWRVVLNAAPYLRKSLRLENTRGSLQFGMPGSNSGTREGGGSVMVWATMSWYSTPSVPLLPFHGRITEREYVGRLGNQMYSMIQTLFPNSAVF